MSQFYIQREINIPFTDLDSKVNYYIKNQQAQEKNVKEVSNDIYRDKTGAIKIVVIESGDNLIIFEQLWNKKKKKYHDIQVTQCPAFEEIYSKLKLLIEEYKIDGKNVEIIDEHTLVRRNEISKGLVLDASGILIHLDQSWNKIKSKYNQLVVTRYGEEASKFLIPLHGGNTKSFTTTEDEK